MDSKTDLKKTCACPNCGGKMAPSNNVSLSLYICPECGSSIDTGEQNYDCNNLCPNCNQILEDNECSYCGYDLGSDFD
jgi:Zn-finger nucleic acid-binding protein